MGILGLKRLNQLSVEFSFRFHAVRLNLFHAVRLNLNQAGYTDYISEVKPVSLDDTTPRGTVDQELKL